MQDALKDLLIRWTDCRKPVGSAAPFVPHELTREWTEIPRPDSSRRRGEPKPLFARPQLLLDHHLRSEIDVHQHHVRHFSLGIANGEKMTLGPARAAATCSADLGDVVPQRRRDHCIPGKRKPDKSHYALLL